MTEFGGILRKYEDKILEYIVAACVEKKVIGKNHREINEVIEAAEEASKGFLITSSDILNIAMKISVIWDKE